MEGSDDHDVAFKKVELAERQAGNPLVDEGLDIDDHARRVVAFFDLDAWWQRDSGGDQVDKPVNGQRQDVRNKLEGSDARVKG